MNKIIILVTIFIFTTLSEAQSVSCDSCKGDTTYYEQVVLNDSVQVSISTFENNCSEKNDNSVPRCYEIEIINSNSLDTIQTLSDILHFSGSQPFQNIIKIQDVNFDGFKDLIIRQNDLGEYRSFFHVYVFDSPTKLFQFREYYQVIFIGYWEINYEEKTLFTTYEAGFHTYVDHKYKFINGEYEEVEEEN